MNPKPRATNYLQTLGLVDAALEVSRVEGVLDVKEFVHFSAGGHL